MLSSSQLVFRFLISLILFPKFNFLYLFYTFFDLFNPLNCIYFNNSYTRDAIQTLKCSACLVLLSLYSDFWYHLYLFRNSTFYTLFYTFFDLFNPLNCIYFINFYTREAIQTLKCSACLALLNLYSDFWYHLYFFQNSTFYTSFIPFLTFSTL